MHIIIWYITDINLLTLTYFIIIISLYSSIAVLLYNNLKKLHNRKIKIGQIIQNSLMIHNYNLDHNIKLIDYEIFNYKFYYRQDTIKNLMTGEQEELKLNQIFNHLNDKSR